MSKKSQSQKKAEHRIQKAIESLTCADLKNALWTTERQYSAHRELLDAVLALKQCPQEDPKPAPLFSDLTDFRARRESPLQPKLFPGWEWWK